MGKVKIGIIVVILIAMVGGYYFYLSNIRDTGEETVVTEVQNVLLKNLDTDYPPTPREVLRYYSDITKCLYSEKYTEEQFEQMADKMLALYDTELVENNPREQYIKDLKSDVDDFLQNGYTISTYTTSRSTEVEEYTSEGRKYAKLYCTYTIKSGAEYKSTQEVFVMRRDAETSRWKIFGFDVVNPEQSAQ
ncbi:MAG: hypothetical protein K2N73_15830 [Lachnospiraceae bacterium]|nr:hypothetical protein [Lachnospiraceae bacterium]